MKEARRIKLLEVPFEQEVEGIEVLNTYTTSTIGYDLVYVQNDKGPEPIHIMKLKNAALSEKIHIKTYEFEEIIEELYNARSDELESFSPRKIRVFVNESWEPAPQSKPNSVIKASIAKASKQYNDQTGYEYLITLRRHFIKEWSDAQLVACMFSLLLKIQEDGSIRKPHLDEVDQIVSTFGANYLDKGVHIPNILTENVEFKKIEKAKRTQQEIEFDEDGNGSIEGQDGPPEDYDDIANEVADQHRSENDNELIE